ncbi:trypsin-like serine peptidase [Microlunatus soli]|uniref:V8-like Glu-specific endopeptidase n=1 Tax=Microlunatus soli TaxID=630515 RepID=A0A1H2AP27_9ACTN|nr:trypsin-like peptidase domain-containing protein [Microlunatus soli]SDT47522.1 hypothetical protein SAMN04489812_6093 [Microlunatus soli]
MKRMPPIAAAIATVIAAAGLAAAPTAQAEPQHPSPTVHPAATTTAEQRKVDDYWTADRMKSAEQRTVRPAADWKPSKVETGAPTVQHGQPSTAGNGSTKGKGKKPKDGDAYLGGPWTGGGAVVKTTGKVFFTLGGTDYVCSGSAIESDNKNTVSTAGHCVNEGPGEYATNFVFVPAYDDGAAPYGKWKATGLSTSEQWRTEGDFNYDIGFAVVDQVDGKNLTDVVGSQSVGFNLPRGEFLYSFGYPQARPYDGTTLDYCSATAGADALGGSEDQRLDCNMTGGSSGGPWFDDFDESAGTGVQVSVNSFGYTSDHNAMYGPYFGSVIEDVYSSAQTVA